MSGIFDAIGKIGGSVLEKAGDVSKGVAKAAAGVSAPYAAAAIGGVQAIGGAIQQRKADRMLPQAEDPEMRNALTQARRKQRAFQTGTALAAERNALAKQLGTGQSRMLRYGGGGRKGLLQMQEVFNKGMMGLAQQSMQGETAASAQANKLLEGISQRKLDLQMQRYDTAQARAAQKKAAANRNLGLFLGKTLGTGQEAEDADVSNTASNAANTKPAAAAVLPSVSANSSSRSSTTPLPTSNQNFSSALSGVQNFMAGGNQAAQSAQGLADLFRTFGTG